MNYGVNMTGSGSNVIVWGVRFTGDDLPPPAGVREPRRPDTPPGSLTAAADAPTVSPMTT